MFKTKSNLLRLLVPPRGYSVSTVGRDEAVVRDYIRNQEQEDRRLEKLKLH